MKSDALHLLPAPPRTLIDLDFKGGTAVDFLDAVRKAAGDRINIVAMPHVEEISVPPISLRRVDVVAAVSLLEGEHLESSNRVVMLRVQPVSGPTLGGRGGAAHQGGRRREGFRPLCVRAAAIQHLVRRRSHHRRNLTRSHHQGGQRRARTARPGRAQGAGPLPH